MSILIERREKVAFRFDTVRIIFMILFDTDDTLDTSAYHPYHSSKSIGRLRQYQAYHKKGDGQCLRN